MEYVFVTIGGFLVGWNAMELWRNGYSRENLTFAGFGLVLAAYGVFS